MLRLSKFLGTILNLAGFPGWVREGDYQSSFGTDVKVRISPLYTRVSIDGVEIFFHRITGRIDGIGFSQGAGCRLNSISKSFVGQDQDTEKTGE